MSGMTELSNEGMSDFLGQAIGLSYDLLTDILFQINDLNTFDPARELAWNHQLSQITADISQFVEVTTLSAKLLMNKKKIELPAIKESHIHLLFIMKGVNQAQAKLDGVVLDDLIKYELKDNLTQWKIDLIPQMKKLLNA